jgi:hypothetical protein
MVSLKRESLFNGPVTSACMRIAYSGYIQVVQRLRARGVSHKERSIRKGFGRLTFLLRWSSRLEFAVLCDRMSRWEAPSLLLGSKMRMQSVRLVSTKRRRARRIESYFCQCVLFRRAHRPSFNTASPFPHRRCCPDN